MYVIKKDNTHEAWNVQKVVVAVNKSAYRALVKFTPEELDFICRFVEEKARSLGKEGIPIAEMHNIVEGALEQVKPEVAKSYRDYRNYKQDFVRMLDEVYKKSQSIMYIGDKENSNTDSALVSTKRSLVFNQLNKELYQKFFMTTEELQACRDGYLYIHDMSARRDTMNCCLFDVKSVLTGGFEMGNLWYNEPKTLEVAFDVIGDIVLSAASQQYGGFTVPSVDQVLDYYLELIRQLHIRTYAYLGEMRASTNPLAYCEGGFYGGHLGIHDKIKPLLKAATASFGITALNELQELHNGKSLVEDGQFAIDTLQHINDKINEYKQADGNLYAIYGTPAESLCGLQVTQFRKKYGIVENVSDRPYVSNSFHCHVTEDISPIEKQDLEKRFWDLSNGGKIQYVKYPIDYNLDAIRTLVRRAMKMGFYEGVNLSLAYCDDCGHQELEMDVCPKCGSKNLTKIERMNGYLSYSRVKGDTRLNDAKMAEIAERKSM